MNYEQKYKEALKVIESLYNVVRHQSSSDALFVSQTIEKAFPELKESEDERIRKLIINFVYLNESQLTELETKQVYAWLEKQRERSGLTKDEEFTLNRIIEHFEEEGGYDKWIEVLQDIRNIPYQKEQNADWREEDEKNFSSLCEFFTAFSDKHYRAYGRKEEMEKWLFHRFRNYPPRQEEWNDEDKERLNSIKDALRHYNYKSDVVKYKDFEWLEELPHRANLKTKQEWSEEDERILYNIERYLAFAENREGVTVSCFNEAKDWLKSLKDRVQPQLHWKPSEEQMEALTIAVHDSHEHRYYKNLYSLYNDLKNFEL